MRLLKKLKSPRTASPRNVKKPPTSKNDLPVFPSLPTHYSYKQWNREGEEQAQDPSDEAKPTINDKTMVRVLPLQGEEAIRAPKLVLLRSEGNKGESSKAEAARPQP